MTVALAGKEIVSQIERQVPGQLLKKPARTAVLVKSDSLLAVAAYLKDTPELKFDYLNYITAVDYYSYFEVVYQLTSLEHNRSVMLKTRCYTRDNPVAALGDRAVAGGRFPGARDLRPHGHYVRRASEFEAHRPLGRVSRGIRCERTLTSDDHEELTLKTEPFVLNIGPVHPSTHGVFRMRVHAGRRGRPRYRAGLRLPAPRHREAGGGAHLYRLYPADRPPGLHLPR